MSAESNESTNLRGSIRCLLIALDRIRLNVFQSSQTVALDLIKLPIVADGGALLTVLGFFVEIAGDFPCGARFVDSSINPVSDLGEHLAISIWTVHDKAGRAGRRAMAYVHDAKHLIGMLDVVLIDR